MEAAPGQRTGATLMRLVINLTPASDFEHFHALVIIKHSHSTKSDALFR